MTEKLVSVVIPTYNRGHSIERAVDSALAQDYPMIEIIVLDDGSKDDTRARIERTYSGNSKVRYVYQPNAGVANARNHGYSLAKGEYIACLDSDDYWLPGKLSPQVAILEAHPEVSLCWTDMDAINPEGKVTASWYLRKMYTAYRFFPQFSDLFNRHLKTPEGVDYYIGDLSAPLVLGNLIHTSTIVARTERLLKAGPYSQARFPSDDHDYYYRVCKTGPVAFLNTVTLHYTIGAPDAATASQQSVAMASTYLKLLNDLIELEGPGIKLPRSLVRQTLADAHFWLGSSYLSSGNRPEARKYLIRSLKINPLSRKALLYFAVSITPSPLVRFAKSMRSPPSKS